MLVPENTSFKKHRIEVEENEETGAIYTGGSGGSVSGWRDGTVRLGTAERKSQEYPLHKAWKRRGRKRRNEHIYTGGSGGIVNGSMVGYDR